MGFGAVAQFAKSRLEYRVMIYEWRRFCIATRKMALYYSEIREARVPEKNVKVRFGADLKHKQLTAQSFLVVTCLMHVQAASRKVFGVIVSWR